MYVIHIRLLRSICNLNISVYPSCQIKRQIKAEAGSREGRTKQLSIQLHPVPLGLLFSSNEIVFFVDFILRGFLDPLVRRERTAMLAPW